MDTNINISKLKVSTLNDYKINIDEYLIAKYIYENNTAMIEKLDSFCFNKEASLKYLKSIGYYDGEKITGKIVELFNSDLLFEEFRALYPKKVLVNGGRGYRSLQDKIETARRLYSIKTHNDTETHESIMTKTRMYLDNKAATNSMEYLPGIIVYIRNEMWSSIDEEDNANSIIPKVKIT